MFLNFGHSDTFFFRAAIRISNALAVVGPLAVLSGPLSSAMVYRRYFSNAVATSILKCIEGPTEEQAYRSCILQSRPELAGLRILFLREE